MSACTGFHEDLVAWIDGELDGARARDVGEHVGGCQACTSAVARQRALWGLLGEDLAPSVPEGFASRVAEAAAPPRSTRPRWPWAGLALAASVAAAVWFLRPAAGPAVHPGDTASLGSAVAQGDRPSQAQEDSVAPVLEKDDEEWIEENWDALVFLEEVDLDAMLDEMVF